MNPATKTTIGALLDGVLFVLFAYAVGLTGLAALGAALGLAALSWAGYSLLCNYQLRGPIYQCVPRVAMAERAHLWVRWSRGYRVFVFVLTLLVVFGGAVL